MGFVSYDGFKERALQGPGITIDKLITIGDIVDSKIVEEFRGDIPPLYNSPSLLQMGEVYTYSKDDEGTSRPCYLTFSFQNNEWVFCGACFKQSVINRSNVFDYAPLTVGEYCVDKFNSEYIRAAEVFYSDKQHGVDVSNVSIIDDYMHFTPFSMAGYWIDTHGTSALENFKESWADYKDDELYLPVIKLIGQQAEQFKNIVWNKQFRQPSQRIGDINALISNATERTNVLNASAGISKENFEIDK